MKNITKQQWQVIAVVGYFFSGILLLALLSGCGTFTGMFTQDKPLAERIDDAKILITATAQEVTDGVNQGFYAKDEARPFVGQLDDALTAIKAAETFLNTGDLTSAEAQYKLADAALTSARNWLRSKSRQKGAGKPHEGPTDVGYLKFLQEQTA